MCELFAYHAKEKKPLSSFLEFQEFMSHSKDNPDGWGIGYYIIQRVLVRKQPRSALESRLLQEISADDISTKTLVAHIRHASVGEKTYINTHPFTRHALGRQWIFAHNGNIADYASLPYGMFIPLGNTDSEHIFLWLLHLLETSKKSEQQSLVDAAAYLRSKGRCNFLLTDGKTLYAHADDTPETKKLHYIERNDVVVVSTYPLTQEPWKRVGNGELLICRDGKVVERIL